MSELWGSWVPTWLQGVGTVGAFGTGGFLLIREFRRDREKDAETLRQRAALFSAWPSMSEDRSGGIAVMERQLTLNNAGTDPIYNVHLALTRSDGRIIEDHIELVPPGNSTRELPFELKETWVRGDRGWRRQGTANDPVIDDPRRLSSTFHIALKFTDSNGKRWQRDAHGVLDLMK